MKVSKHVHSCLLIEENNKSILIDPGNYTFESNALDIDSIKELDYLLITHKHPDHIYIPAVKSLIAKFPDLQIISNSFVVDILNREGIKAKSDSNDFIKIKEAKHEKVFGLEASQNSLFIINNLLTDPGDSLSFDSTTKILALPVQAPWGSLTQAVDLAIKLKPEVIIPIHDWHWNEEAREAFYKRLEIYFKEKGIHFVQLQTGIAVEI